MFRFSKLEEIDEEGNIIIRTQAQVINEGEATENDIAQQDDHMQTNKETGRKLTSEEIEEREQARREALRLFKEEQTRLVEKERKEREEKWQQVSKWSTVVSISITPSSFKPVSLSLSRLPLSKTPKQVFF